MATLSFKKGALFRKLSFFLALAFLRFFRTQNISRLSFALTTGNMDLPPIFSKLAYSILSSIFFSWLIEIWGEPGCRSGFWHKKGRVTVHRSTSRVHFLPAIRLYTRIVRKAPFRDRLGWIGYTGQKNNPRTVQHSTFGDCVSSRNKLVSRLL